MNTLNQSLLSSQKKLLEMFLANAGSEYIGEKFTFSQQNKIKYFSCKTARFCLDISNPELLSLAQQGYLQLFTNPPSIIFTEKTLEKTGPGTDIAQPSNRESANPQSEVLKQILFRYTHG